MFSHLQNQSNSFYNRTPIGRIMSRMQSDILQLQETFELLALALAELVTVGAIIILMLIVKLAVGPGLHVRGAGSDADHDVLAAIRQTFVHADQAGHCHG